MSRTRDPRLFIGVYPCGLVYADRSRERHGDYVRLGFLPYASLNLMLEPDCPADLAALIRADAQAMRARTGERFPISSSGQSVVLGSRA